MFNDVCHIVISKAMSTNVSKCQGSQSCIEGHEKHQVNQNQNIIE